MAQTHRNVLIILLLTQAQCSSAIFFWVLLCMWVYFFFVCVFGFLFWPSEDDYHLVIAPQSPVVQIGSNLTAICMINNTTEVTADDLYWKLSEIIPKEHYIKINSSALNVTVTIRSEKSEWLFCSCKTESHYVVLNRGKFTHGIWLRKGCKFLLS